MWKVVIIDDDERVLRGLKMIIPWDQLECEWVGQAKNGEQGLELIQRTTPDLVITDIYMPIKNGLEMVEELRKSGFEGHVIILSGYSDFEYARKAMRLKINDYLSKPASRDTIKEVLKRTIGQMEEKNTEELRFSELRSKVMRYEPLIEKEWIKSVITESSIPKSPPEKAKKLIEKWEQCDHAVVMITSVEQKGRSPLLKKDWYLFRFVLGDVIKEAATRIFSEFHYAEFHSNQAALLIHLNREDHTEQMNKLNQLKDFVQKSLGAHLGIESIMTIGSITRDWRLAYQSTNEALHQLPLFEKQEQTEADLSGVKVPKELTIVNRQLSEAIRYADEESACAAIQLLYESIGTDSYHKQTAIRLGIELWALMTYSLYDIGIRIEDLFSEDYDIYKELTSLHSWDEFSELLKNNVINICKSQRWDENLKHRQLIEQMLDFIQDHMDQNITLQDLAEKLYISRNYLGKIFKQVVGESFKDYLLRVRMEKAKTMIQEGTYLIYEISENVGYGNPAYFSSAFKKYTGYTPTDLIQKRMKA
ncbi:response regulator transcription factor [Alkalicoccobacillus murimartini]|uniref:Two-component system response regulator YesN n=1 Tax=Alkalicoccobacillus murimartini TaxID=171685 RepID=A0ABT9YI95_9BACI|nr:response regulator transcription factor [Alkalicoccobacillus murimartini]MDQ0207241.1 two-component system response regulator YesN [Alkalicoccobacillus murimartini]